MYQEAISAADKVSKGTLDMSIYLILIMLYVVTSCTKICVGPVRAVQRR